MAASRKRLLRRRGRRCPSVRAPTLAALAARHHLADRGQQRAVDDVLGQPFLAIVRFTDNGHHISQCAQERSHERAIVGIIVDDDDG